MVNKMFINLNGYKLENDVDFKVIPDGYEIFAHAVEREQISTDDFTSAYCDCYNIIVETI